MVRAIEIDWFCPTVTLPKTKLAGLAPTEPGEFFAVPVPPAPNPWHPVRVSAIANSSAVTARLARRVCGTMVGDAVPDFVNFREGRLILPSFALQKRAR